MRRRLLVTDGSATSGGGRRVLVAASAAALAAFAALAGPAGPGNPRDADAPVARLVHGSAATLTPARLARSSVVWGGGPTIAATGETVNVFVSAALRPSSARRRRGPTSSPP